MKFTIVLPSRESEDLSIGCLFMPCLAWKIGQRKILVPHRDNPHYLPGDFQYMLEVTEVGARVDQTSKKVVLITHMVGHGTWLYRSALTLDIRKAGYEPVLVDL